MAVDYRVGDVRDVMATVADASIALVATSPPFLALRSYLPADHPDKWREIGSESTPAAYLDTLLELTAEWGRVLAPWGSIAVELGDSYRSKGLTLSPQAYALSLAYGINVLTGQPSPAGKWLVRNVIVWHRPNPPVAALGDKVRPSTSYITVATRSPKRWFDLDAVRTPTDRFDLGGNGGRALAGGRSGGDTRGGPHRSGSNPAGAPPLDCWFDGHDTWTVTGQTRLAHYATWPAKLAERLILMMAPAEVCAICGEPRRSDCRHDDYRPGVVLDPFAGTGTTLAVADLHGRDAIGIDLDVRNRELYPARRDECARKLR